MISTLLLALAATAGNSVTGTVVDDLGAPVARAEVRLANRVGGRGVGAGANGIYANLRTLADAQGRFRFDGAEREVVLEAQAEGHMISDDAWLTLPTRRPVVLTVERMAKARGRLVLDGARPADAAIDGWSPVGPDGRFDLFVRTNAHQIVISGSNFATIAIPVQAAPGKVNELGDVVLERGATVDLVVQSAGKPLAGVNVELQRLDLLRARQQLARRDPEQWRVQSFSWDPLRIEGVSSQQGTIRIQRLPRGRYLLWGDAIVPPTELEVTTTPARVVLEAIAPAVLEIGSAAHAGNSGDDESNVVVLDCGGRFVRIKLERGAATAKAAPGACYLATPFRTFEHGARTVELKSGETSRVRLIDAR